MWKLHTHIHTRTLRHATTDTRRNVLSRFSLSLSLSLTHTHTHCNTLQHTATNYNTRAHRDPQRHRREHVAANTATL